MFTEPRESLLWRTLQKQFDPVGWADSTGGFWIFGGAGLDSNGSVGELNDLWRFTRSSCRKNVRRRNCLEFIELISSEFFVRCVVRQFLHSVDRRVLSIRRNP